MLNNEALKMWPHAFGNDIGGSCSTQAEVDGSLAIREHSPECVTDVVNRLNTEVAASNFSQPDDFSL